VYIYLLVSPLLVTSLNNGVKDLFRGYPFEAASIGGGTEPVLLLRKLCSLFWT
jgi:hypothetical protein